MVKLSKEYSLSDPAVILTIYVLTSLTLGMVQNLISGLGEEIGWRGLLVPELARMTSFTKTAFHRSRLQIWQGNQARGLCRAESRHKVEAVFENDESSALSAIRLCLRLVVAGFESQIACARVRRDGHLRLGSKGDDKQDEDQEK